MTRRQYPDPGPRPINVTPKEIEKWRKAKELHDCEGFQELDAGLPKGVDATDRVLKASMNDHKKFLDMNNPATEALKFVLLRNASDVLYDAEMMRRYLQSISMGQRRAGDGVIDAPHRPSLVVLAEQLVAQGLRGDATAASAIFDRIEGKTGLRRDDVDPADPQRQRQSREIVEGVVRAMTARRQENAIDVTVEPVEPKLAITKQEETK